MTDQTANFETAGLDFLKLVTVGAPILATSIALFYDVGFFHAIGQEFFTFFSVSEHLLFALQSLPLALLVALWTIFVGAFLKISDKLLMKKAQLILALTQDVRRSEMSWIVRFAKRLAVFGYKRAMVLLLIFGSAILYAILGGPIMLAFILMWGVGVVALLFFLSSFPFASLPIGRRFLIGVASVSTIWGLALSVGIDRGTKLRNSPAGELISIGDKKIAVRLVRVGERGVLFVVPSEKKIRFARWDDVKGIETIPQ